MPIYTHLTKMAFIFLAASLSLKGVAQIYNDSQYIEYAATKTINAHEISLGTIFLKSSSLPWQISTREGKITVPNAYKIIWGKIENGKTVEHEYTGATVTNKLVFLHPPRTDAFPALEFCPFPQIQRPALIGSSWKWTLENIPNNYFKALKNTTFVPDLSLVHQYSITGTKKWFYKPKRTYILCYEVMATCKSEMGKSSLRALYSIEYGFVELDFRCMDGNRYLFNMSYFDIPKRSYPN